MNKFIIRTVPTGVKFDLKAPNGQTVLTSEVYRTAAACRKGIASVQKSVLTAALEDLTDASGRTFSNPKFELYRDKAGAYRFRMKARNGAIIAVSDAYAARAGAISGMESVKKNAPGAKVEQVPSDNG